MQSTPEICDGPCADAGFNIGRDVRSIENAERCGKRQTARVRLAPAFGMARYTVARPRKIFPPNLRSTILVVERWLARESERGHCCDQDQQAEQSIALHRFRVDHRWMTLPHS